MSSAAPSPPEQGRQTTTPHSSNTGGFTTFLELLDNQRCARGTPDHKQRDVVQVRQLNSELLRKLHREPRFPKRVLESLKVSCTEVGNHTNLPKKYSQRRQIWWIGNAK